MACLRARVGDAEAALRHLEIYACAFILRNGFHANGDQTKSGFSSMTYRPFTLEGNFLAMEAVHEMLLQSWDAPELNFVPGGTKFRRAAVGAIRLFPATPWRWHDAAFDDLRAAGGHRVCARRENNANPWFRIVAGSDGLVRIRDNFGGPQPQSNRPGVKRVGDNFELTMKRGEVLEATLPKPKVIPPAPDNAAEPVVIRKQSAITPNKLPLRIGADSQENNRFAGEIAHPAVFERALTAAEIRQLASRGSSQPANPPGCVVMLAQGDPGVLTNLGNPRVTAKPVGELRASVLSDDLAGRDMVLAGQGYIEIPHDNALDGLEGLTLAAWILPRAAPASGMRIIGKSPVGEASGCLLDTYPGNSLRLTTRDPRLTFKANLPTNQWSRVAATVNGQTGKQILYLNGKPVAESDWESHGLFPRR